MSGQQDQVRRCGKRVSLAIVAAPGDPAPAVASVLAQLLDLAAAGHLTLRERAVERVRQDVQCSAPAALLWIVSQSAACRPSARDLHVKVAHIHRYDGLMIMYKSSLTDGTVVVNLSRRTRRIGEHVLGHVNHCRRILWVRNRGCVAESCSCRYDVEQGPNSSEAHLSAMQLPQDHHAAVPGSPARIELVAVRLTLRQKRLRDSSCVLTARAGQISKWRHGWRHASRAMAVFAP